MPKQEVLPPRQEALKLEVDNDDRFITNNYGLIDMKGTFSLMAQGKSPLPEPEPEE